ncbi:MAG: hypothetical protein EOL97_13690 [Spirochaetia bacterium]|nr:hypothetical protein [Spirochaetia bacterium]
MNFRETNLETVLSQIDKYNNFILTWATGVGKSFAAISIQEKIKATSTLICVSEQAHIENWKAEYIKHNKASFLESTEIICYQSLHKYEGKKYDLLVCDEAHHLTDNRVYKLLTITAKKVVSLSATLSYEEIDLIKSIWGPAYINKVSLSKATKEGILTPPLLFLYPLQLNNTSRDQLIFYKKGKPTSVFKIDYSQLPIYIRRKDISLEIRATEAEKYEYLTNQMNIYKLNYLESRVEFMKRKWLMLGSERKRYLSSLKTDYIKKVIKSIGDKKILCFCGSIEQALTMNGVAIHSKMKKSEKNIVLNNYINGTTKQLFAVGMLKEGVNIPNIEAVIISQLDDQERSFIQKSGRVLRNLTDPEIHVLYFLNTQDEKYMETALNGTNMEMNLIYL